jgi:7-carboxy-7-deazaguanine synthase
MPAELKTLIDQVETGMALPVMEAFYTLQGEGVHAGKASYFIRLAGCDVGCHWCDVKESWDAEKHPILSVEDIVTQAAQYPSRLAVITGGEPLMHNLASLTEKLHQAGFTIHVETSGAYSLCGDIDWICLSPKKFKAPLPEIYKLAHELKVIVYNNHDLVWAEEQAKFVGPGCALILQPEWSRREKAMPLIVEFIKNNPRWRMGLQTHKYLDIP